MGEEESWRQRLAEERFGDSLTPGFAREPVPAAADPFGPPRRRPVFATTLANSEEPAVRPAAPSRITAGRLGWAVAIALALVVAAAAGWVLRGDDRRIVYLPLAAPADRPLAPVDGATVDAEPTFPVAGAAPPAGVIALAPPLASVAPATAVPTRPAPRRAPAPAPAVRRRAPAAAAPVATVPVPVVLRPSFACVAGNGPVASALCSDPTLRRFDEDRQAAEAAIIAHGDPVIVAAAARDRQTALRHRDKCGDRACLTRVYTTWIVDLVRLLPNGAATPPVCLPQQYTRTPIMNCWPSHLRPVRRPFFSD